MSNVLQKIQKNDKINDQLAKIKAIANMIQTQWKQAVDDPDPSAEEEKKVSTSQPFST